MKIVATVAELREARRAWRGEAASIGFAPTMGNLHAGHLGLFDVLRRAGADRLVASIFVNPIQFGANEDLASYPRTFDADCAQLTAAGADLLFAPAVGEIYPPGGAPEARIDMVPLSSELCGAFRPVHFPGVLTVVAKLFHMVGPDIAAFGEKDYQQLVMIRRMVESLNFPVRVVAAPTMRDADGLALSSRNRYLTPPQRAIAAGLHRALVAACLGIGRGRPLAEIEAETEARLRREGFEVDYVAVRAAHDLSRPGEARRELVALGAVRLGQTRLIDNERAMRP